MDRKDNSFALFKNKRKEKDTHADYEGTLVVDGKEYWINAWLNESKAGQKYMSGRIKPKDARVENLHARKPNTVRAAMDDDAPF